MKKLLLLVLCFVSVNVFAVSKETWFCIKNTSTVDQKVYVDYINNTFWDGQARPDVKMNDTTMGVNQTFCNRLEVNSNVKEVHFAVYAIGKYTVTYSQASKGETKTIHESKDFYTYNVFSASKDNGYVWGVGRNNSDYNDWADRPKPINHSNDYKHWPACDSSNPNYFICRKITEGDNLSHYRVDIGLECEQSHPNCVQFNLTRYYPTRY